MLWTFPSRFQWADMFDSAIVSTFPLAMGRMNRGHFLTHLVNLAAFSLVGLLLRLPHLNVCPLHMLTFTEPSIWPQHDHTLMSSTATILSTHEFSVLHRPSRWLCSFRAACFCRDAVGHILMDYKKPLKVQAAQVHLRSSGRCAGLGLASGRFNVSGNQYLAKPGWNGVGVYPDRLMGNVHVHSGAKIRCAAIEYPAAAICLLGDCISSGEKEVPEVFRPLHHPRLFVVLSHPASPLGNNPR
jgi:hypothetical protein